MNRALRFCLLTSTSYFAATSIAWAGNVTAQGAVTALDDVNQMQGIVGSGAYNEANAGGVPLGIYSAQGMTFHTGLLTNVLPGVTTGGSASQPSYQPHSDSYFPQPIGGGGLHELSFAYYGGVVTFDQPVTQLGLTAGRNGTQYLTVWDTNGVMLGQVTWTPANDSAFIGIDANGVPIGMASYCDHNLWAGDDFGVGGSTNHVGHLAVGARDPVPDRQRLHRRPEPLHVAPGLQRRRLHPCARRQRHLPR